jgi:hypothetical protein
MTDLVITTSPIAIRHADPQRLKRPRLSIGATLSAMFKTLEQAFCMAYVAPYGTSRRQTWDASGAEADGRDPRW